jgi:hypothetical protein
MWDFWQKSLENSDITNRIKGAISEKWSAKNVELPPVEGPINKTIRPLVTSPLHEVKLPPINIIVESSSTGVVDSATKIIKNVPWPVKCVIGAVGLKYHDDIDEEARAAKGLSPRAGILRRTFSDAADGLFGCCK